MVSVYVGDSNVPKVKLIGKLSISGLFSLFKSNPSLLGVYLCKIPVEIDMMDFNMTKEKLVLII